MKKAIKFEVTYDHPIANVWKALTDKEAMSEWLMPCDMEPVVGHKFQFRTKPYPGFDGIVNCEVLTVDEPKLLAFSWSGGSLENTRVTFRLEAQGEKTKLHFEHGGFDGLLNKLIVRRILAAGWKKKILAVQLPKYLKHNQ
ncbi:MAG: SRPBCC domain-containing protein [Bacteroidota bacterium]